MSTWAQTFTLVATILVAMIGGLIYGNRRIDDLRSDMDARFGILNKRIDDLIHHFDTRIDDIMAAINRVRT